MEVQITGDRASLNDVDGAPTHHVGLLVSQGAPSDTELEAYQAGDTPDAVNATERIRR